MSTEMIVTRRNALQLIGATALGICFPVIASTATRCRIIGVGDAGSHILLAAWSDGALQRPDCELDFSCVFTGPETLKSLDRANQSNPGAASIGVLQLSTLGTGGNVNDAVSAAYTHHHALRAMTTGADIVILVVGLGGGTGTGIGPMLAGMSQDSGAVTLAIVVTPYMWELGRFPRAFDAVKKLHQSCDYMVALSNEATSNSMGENATLEDVIKQQELEAVESMQMLLKLGTRFIKNLSSSAA